MIAVTSVMEYKYVWLLERLSITQSEWVRLTRAVGTIAIQLHFRESQQCRPELGAFRALFFASVEKCCKIINEILKQANDQESFLQSKQSSVIILIALCTIAIYNAINIIFFPLLHLMERFCFRKPPRSSALHGCLIDAFISLMKCDWQLLSFMN